MGKIQPPLFIVTSQPRIPASPLQQSYVFSKSFVGVPPRGTLHPGYITVTALSLAIHAANHADRGNAGCA